jgi:NAD(P)-dependent dehydrogenase (short-subunit alcohol dehydrogenase family)
MMLENKTAVIYGGGGAIGGAVARAFASAGARVYLAGRTAERLEAAACGRARAERRARRLPPTTRDRRRRFPRLLHR